MTMQDQAAEIDRKVRAGILTQRQAIDMKLQLLPKRAPRDLQAEELKRRTAELDRRLAEHKRRYGSATRAPAQGGKDTRTPAQKLVQLRRDFGDERRNPDLWDTLPMLLQRHWADAKRGAGEVLAPVERRALNYSPIELKVSGMAVRA